MQSINVTSLLLEMDAHRRRLAILFVLAFAAMC
jgi:hypothetical protein